jgi:hypothetical protein
VYLLGKGVMKFQEMMQPIGDKTELPIGYLAKNENANLL